MFLGCFEKSSSPWKAAISSLSGGVLFKELAPLEPGVEKYLRGVDGEEVKEPSITPAQQVKKRVFPLKEKLRVVEGGEPSNVLWEACEAQYVYQSSSAFPSLTQCCARLTHTESVHPNMEALPLHFYQQLLLDRWGEPGCLHSQQTSAQFQLKTCVRRTNAESAPMLHSCLQCSCCWCWPIRGVALRLRPSTSRRLRRM